MFSTTLPFLLEGFGVNALEYVLLLTTLSVFLFSCSYICKLCLLLLRLDSKCSMPFLKIVMTVGTCLVNVLIVPN